MALRGESRLPEGACRAHGVVVHGFAEHRGRYDALVEELAAAGFAAHRFDLRGHGESQGPRGHVGRFEEYRQDLERVVAEVQDRHGEVPLFVLGHSLGGLVVLDWLLDRGGGPRRPAPAGVVLSSPFLAPAFRLPRLAGLVAQTGSLLLPQLGFRSGIDAGDLSHDPEVVRAYREDPQVLDRVSARWFVEVRQAQDRVLAGASGIDLPVLLLLGGADAIADVERSRRLYDVLGGAKQVEVYPGFRHEVLNEIGRERVVADLLAWLDARFPSATVPRRPGPPAR